MANYQVTPLVQELPAAVPFVGPETQERLRGSAFRARIGANENVFGPSPAVIEVMQHRAKEAWMYGDPEFHELRIALAQQLGVAPENVMVGEGIDGLLGYIVRIFVEPGDVVVTSAGAYPTFNYHVQGFGGDLQFVPYHEDREDGEALLTAAQKNEAKLIYFANPDNPMGSWWDADYVESMIKSVPEGSLLVLDEAYGEFAPEGTLPPIDVDNGRVIRMRTFSKAYGLAGMRVGYAIGNAGMIAEFNKVRNHFGLSRLSQIAALEAVQDQEHLNHVQRQVQGSLQRIQQIALDNQLKPLPTAANFLTIDCGRDGDYAIAVMKGLIDCGVFVRMPGVAPLNRCIRITAGLPVELDFLKATLPKVLKSI
ncbi:MAG: pyridoxal phosphate-dependent aminotransferase [Deltaproteobacteria bacterium]|jgi:histidinol-phosphate aminotransferase|nr:pyridoxal phosphate-dependent aminotransferase [Deltaproteobacteria bacterium]MBT7205287.1 pyridoxal phosphate-dependent aminotransferase [Deltaproteobacteria bacterium]MDG2196101.1 pyridoxal phosphate-dependent aminotransferase [SAR324 cluster bacterium]